MDISRVYRCQRSSKTTEWIESPRQVPGNDVTQRGAESDIELS